MRRTTRLTRAALALGLALAASSPAMAQKKSTFSQTWFFGDSLTDAGFFRPLLPLNVQPVTGQFTTNPGLVWSQYLADFYGTGAGTAWVASPTGPTASAGTNYAVGGARTGVSTTGALGPTPSLAAQVTRYLASTGGKADPNALYTVWGGANDLFYANGVYAATLQGGGSQAQAQAQVNAVVAAAVASQVGIVGQLSAAGARYILVPVVPDLGKTPAFLAQGATVAAQASALTKAYNDALFAALAQQNLRVIPLDTFNFIREIAANPSQYGFTNVTGTACMPQITAQSLTCNPTSLVAPNAGSTYAFADGVHPTSSAHKILAQYALSVLEGPRQIAVLPHSAAMVGRARADMLGLQLSAAGEGDGMRWWFGGRVDNQRFLKDHSSVKYDGAGPSLNGGVGWRSGALSYGLFGDYGRQSIDWGERAGSFKQTDATLGGFVGYAAGGLWANALASYSWLDFDVRREMVLGPSVRSHAGSAGGSNVSLGGSAGYDMALGETVKVGPVVSLLSQRIRVDGFAESDPAAATSLAFPDQAYDSLRGSVGLQGEWRASEKLVPWVRMTVDREFEKPAEEAFASLQSMPNAKPYAVPGLDIDRDYGTLAYGVRSKLFGMDVQTGSTLTIGQAGGNHASFFLTVGSAF